MAGITSAQAAQKVSETEIAALSQVRDLLNKLDDDLKAIYDGLGYPSNFRSDAVRVINEIRGQNEFRRTSEIPNLVTTLSPVPEQPLPPTP